MPNAVILSTAMIRVCDLIGYEMYVCALVDQRSQAFFITETLLYYKMSNWVISLKNSYSSTLFPPYSNPKENLNL